jgi:hypothetical protein
MVEFVCGALEQGFVFYSKRARPKSSFGRVFPFSDTSAIGIRHLKMPSRDDSTTARRRKRQPRHDASFAPAISFLYFSEWFSMPQTRNACLKSGLEQATCCSSQSHTKHIQTKIISG